LGDLKKRRGGAGQGNNESKNRNMNWVFEEKQKKWWLGGSLRKRKGPPTERSERNFKKGGTGGSSRLNSPQWYDKDTEKRVRLNFRVGLQGVDYLEK